MKYIVDIQGEIEGDYELIGKYEERPQGEWIYHSDDYIAFYTCDKCGSAGDIQDKFCRNCGANMRGENNG